jgi:hypothetical protein
MATAQKSGTTYQFSTLSRVLAESGGIFGLKSDLEMCRKPKLGFLASTIV